MTDTYTDDQALAILVVHALNQVYVAAECCPECCWPCDVLKQLLDRPDGPGGITDILSRAPGDLNVSYFAWSKDGGVDRDLLESLWTRTDCHKDEGGEGGSVV